MSSSRFMAVEEAPETVYLYPGQLYTAAHATYVTTVLGSCVSVCLWDPVAQVGGINHFVLPKGKGPRYGNEAMQELLDAMIVRGAFAARIVAKVFGGARVLAASNSSGKSIGTQNVEAARAFLEAHSIPIRAEQTEGTHGRKLLFHTSTGHVYIKEITRG